MSHFCLQPISGEDLWKNFTVIDCRRKWDKIDVGVRYEILYVVYSLNRTVEIVQKRGILIFCVICGIGNGVRFWEIVVSP